MERINLIFTTFVGQIEHVRLFLNKINNKKVYIKVFLDDFMKFISLSLFNSHADGWSL